MIRLIAGLSRSLPLVIALIVLGLVVYAFVSWWKSPIRAKEVSIKVFLVTCAAISSVSALVSLYAVIDHNTPVLELALSCVVVGAIGLAITLICRAVFIKNHPNYKYEPTGKTKVEGETRPGKAPDALDLLERALRTINNIRHRNR